MSTSSSSCFAHTCLTLAACLSLVFLSGCGDENRLVRGSGTLNEQAPRSGQERGSDRHEQAPGQTTPAPQAGTPAQEPDGGSYRVLLTDGGPNKIALIKVIREFTGLGLADAKDLTEHAPIPVVSGISLPEAQALLGEIEATGARGEIQPMTGGAKVGIPETGQFEVVLVDPGRNHIMVIKAVREITGYGLKDAKDLIDATPATVRLCWTREQAEETAALLNKAGARTEIRS